MLLRGEIKANSSALASSIQYYNSLLLPSAKEHQTIHKEFTEAPGAIPALPRSAAQGGILQKSWRFEAKFRFPLSSNCLHFKRFLLKNKIFAA